MKEFEIRMFDSEDETLKKIGSKIEAIDQRSKENVGAFKHIWQMVIQKQKNKLLLEYDKRTLELGRKKPSGYHG